MMSQLDTGIYMDLKTLGTFARNTASTMEREGTVSGRRIAAECGRVLRSLKGRLAPIGEAQGFSEAREWFSDNWYIVEREGKDAAIHLAGIGKLPRCAGNGRAIVSEAAGALARSGRGEVTEERIRLFLDEYQQVSPLSERELAVFVPALKAELAAFLDQVFPEDPSVIENDGELSLLLRNIFTSLRLLSGIDVSDILEEVNRVERCLREDPAGVYPLMDEETRASYRRALARLAEKRGVSEFEAARTVLSMAQEGEERHVGTYIFQKPFGERKKSSAGGWYIGLILLTTLFLTVLVGVLLDSVLASALLLIPLSEIVKNLVDFVSIRVKRPVRLPRLELEGGIPKSGRTICVISALLTRPADGERYARLLEEYKLLNRDAGENLTFGILADLKESQTLRARDDANILEAAGRAVEKLNKKYGGGFCLLYRDRELNETDGVYMGRERKRGAIEELIRLLSGEKSTLRVIAGDAGAVRETNFILTLDADTRLTSGSARELVGAALHPLNIPLVDEKEGRVVEGYGILQPRVAVELTAAGRSDFTRVFAGEGGIDPYNAAVSDVYQDLFGEGTFMGKGLLNVPVYKKLLDKTFPDNTILSHDILEGAYLRCAFASDTELTDGYPYKVTSFFARQERWIRGDWQNIRWCGNWVKNKDGALIRNRLNSLSRWKLVDNLRRSLVPVMIFLSLLMGMLFSGRGFLAAGVAAALAELSGLLLGWAEKLIKHDGSSRARYQSAIISGVAGAMMQTAIRLMLLPAEAWMSLRAIVTVVYRMTVSHRKMLSWVTSSDAERKYGNTLAVNYLKLMACPIAGILILLLTPYAAAGAVGIVWLFAPAYAWALSRENRRVSRVSGLDRGFLLSCAGDIWRYFEENLREEDHYLPPDNVQEEPDLGPAHRTSPTNIGLAMLSCVAAADLGLIPESRASELVEKTLATLEKLSKWNGHLYNWYDTQTLLSLEPRYISTVDSGNLAGCLIALTSWFSKRGEEKTAALCKALADAMDFRPLFDQKRKLFYIGYDLQKSAPTEGWYDLLASEARITSYIAIASGQVPRKHWRRLGRALVSLDSYSGMASWTGTMFEYLMPNLLMPCYENSLLYESASFCLYAQKRAHPGIPWGISESAYYAFDPGLSYRYKAHGVPRLALKRKMGMERVVSPYSSFLALTLDTRGAARNLRRLASQGMVGRYGFYEAADFTPSRLRDGKCEVVRTYMAHHLGMSLIAIANALCGDAFPKRFMEDERMAAYAELLEERVPTGAVVLRQPPRDVPEKPNRQENAGYVEYFTGVDAFEPRCLPLSNGAYSVLLAESGKTRSKWQGLDMTRFDGEAAGSGGMALYLKTPDGLMPITAAPDYDQTTRYSTEFTDKVGRVEAKKGGVTAVMTVTVPPSGAGEKRTVEITAPAGITDVSLVCFFEPVLERREDYMAHPAFSKLSLEAELVSDTLLLRRRPREGRREVWFAVAADGPLAAATEHGRGVLPGDGCLKKTTPDMRVSVSVPIALTAGRGAVTLAFAPAFQREEALTAARRILERRETQAISRIGAAALMLGMRTSDVRAALLLITGLVFGTRPSDRRAELLASGRFGRESLWRFGVSGDLPILSARIETAGELDGAKALIREHAFLTENGVDCDLVLLLTDGGDYRSAQRGAILELLRRLGRDGTVGGRGGVHLVDDADPESAGIEARSSLFVRLSAIPAAPAHMERMPSPERTYTRGSEPLEYRMAPDGVFRMAIRDQLPPAAWSHVLANEDFGFLATECGTGFMWVQNSRQMKLNRWLGDPNATVGTEKLELIRGGERVSLFADGSGAPTLVEYGFGYARWERELSGIVTRVTAFVPPDTPARVLLVELTGELADAQLGWFTELTLGEENALSPGVVTKYENGVITAKRPDGEYGGVTFTALPSETPAAFTCDRDAYLRGELAGFTGAGVRPCAAMVFPAVGRLVLVTGCAPFGELDRLLRDPDRALEETKAHWRGVVDCVKVRTGNANIDAYMNGWALYQTVACRIFARTGFYQNGGAVGFRDQLQDVCAVAAFMPELAARQIKKAAEHQYTEGDVQHWWHEGPMGDAGVRTRCSDDLLWLPYALTDHVAKTGDHGLCRVRAHYLTSAPLGDGERDRYERPQRYPDQETILQHAIRAADLFLSRGVGEHGLSLMLGGDWNDGMDAVGREGRGESVWLTFFGSLTLRRLAALCQKEGEAQAAERFALAAEALLSAAERAFEGDQYLRGFYDDGTPLGAAGGSECAIDSIAQSFAVFAGVDPDRSRRAVLTAYERLYDKENRVVKLFDPPFDGGAAKPGYIKAYAPGFRENGGQYTHAAVWLAMALLRSGEREKGLELLSAISPWGRDTRTFVTEPYVLPGDVYAAPGHVGRGGWSWYTGSAGWYFRAVTEELLGLHVRDGVLYPEPKIPCGEARLEGELRIESFPEGVTVNGEPYKNEGIPLKIHNKVISNMGKP